MPIHIKFYGVLRQFWVRKTHPHALPTNTVHRRAIRIVIRILNTDSNPDHPQNSMAYPKILDTSLVKVSWKSDNYFVSSSVSIMVY